jgi:hypothetical protein
MPPVHYLANFVEGVPAETALLAFLDLPLPPGVRLDMTTYTRSAKLCSIRLGGPITKSTNEILSCPTKPNDPTLREHAADCCGATLIAKDSALRRPRWAVSYTNPDTMWRTRIRSPVTR